MNLKLSEVPKESIRVLGRNTGKLDPLTLFWTGSGIELSLKASELYMSFVTDYEAYEQWISIFVNGAFISRQMLPKGKSEVCLFRNMNPSDTKEVRVLKEVQAMSDDAKATFQITEIRMDGSFDELGKRPYLFEFIGDSITSGEGTAGALKELDWISMFFSVVNHYGVLTAKEFDADFRIVSQSGWGTVTGWDNDTRHTLVPHYEKVCSLLKGSVNEQYGCMEAFDFGAGADAVIVNLGTNDCGALDQPPFTNPETGETYASRRNADGTLSEDTKNRLLTTATGFLETIRKNNPNAQIVWVLGMLGDYLCPTFEEAVEIYKRKNGDDKVSFLRLPDTTPETVGSRSHPGALCHKMAASVLSQYLHSVLV